MARYSRKDPTEHLNRLIKEREERKLRIYETALKNDDEIDQLRNTRIISDMTRDNERKAFRTGKEYERQERQKMGASAWFSMQEQRRKENEKEQKEINADELAHDVTFRKELRDIRREEREAMQQRIHENEKMEAQKREEEARRERERLADERKEREEAWARQELKRDKLRRERKAYREECERREREKEIQKSIEANREKLQQERDHSVASDLARIQARKAQERKRREKAAEKTAFFDSLTATGDIRDLSLTYDIFAPENYEKDHDHLTQKVADDELHSQELKDWYTERSFDRTDRHRRAINSIYS